jgi:DNA invertase Pin-like site-specific DNA recombinase
VKAPRQQIAAYLRVSSRAQDAKTQRSAIGRASDARGDRIDVWYSEKKSASTFGRPELARIRADARAGRLHKLYVFRLDRLARTGIRDMFEVIDELRAHGVQVVTVADGFDLDGPHAEILIAVIAWAAKMERLATAERIAAARDRIDAEGGHWGRPRRMDDAMVEKARTLRRNGQTIRQISARLKTPRATVARALSRKPAACRTRRGRDSQGGRPRQQGASRLAATETRHKRGVRP